METPFGSVPDRYLDRSMAEVHEYLTTRVSRRDVLRAAALGAGTIAAGPLLWRRPGFAAAVPEGLHLAYGADPRTEMAVSWLTREAVQGAVLDVGLDDTYGATLPADTRTVVGTQTVYHHARVPGLAAGTTYHYRVRHDGSETGDMTFVTAPAAAEPFRFTSFGDQGTSASARSTTDQVVAQKPAFHFHVGDLCYAYSTGTGDITRPAPLYDQFRNRFTNQTVWDTWFTMVGAQASRAPWMPTVGNHEMEYGYGPLGYDGYLARFTLPADAVQGRPVTYAFRYANVGVIALDGNDRSDEIPSNRGYTGGAQDQWLRDTLASMRAADSGIDFIVIGFHNCNYCTNVVHSSDGGTRGWGPIFDEYAVDLVVNGHNHQYERTHPIRGGAPTKEVGNGDIVDPAADGTTYITAGGGGQVSYQATLYPAGYVNLYPGARVPETAEWSATRYLDISFIACDVTPRDASGVAEMTVRAIRPNGTPIESVTLRRSTAP